MKNYISILMVGISLMCCTENEEVTYRADAELSPYVDKFFSEADEHGVSLEKNLVAKLGDAQAVVNYTIDNDQKILIYDKDAFNQHSNVQRQAYVCFTLGKVFLGRSYEAKPGTFMNAIPAYNPADEEAMFDELFSNE
jgi:hypothetical protein